MYTNMICIVDGNVHACIELILFFLATDVNANVEITCKSDDDSGSLYTENSSYIPEDTVQAVKPNQPKIGLTDCPETISFKQKGKSPAPEKNSDDAIKKTEISKDLRKPTCMYFLWFLIWFLTSLFLYTYTQYFQL